MIPKVPQSYLSIYAIQIRLEMVIKQVLECTILGENHSNKERDNTISSTNPCNGPILTFRSSIQWKDFQKGNFMLIFSFLRINPNHFRSNVYKKKKILLIGILDDRNC